MPFHIEYEMPTGKKGYLANKNKWREGDLSDNVEPKESAAKPTKKSNLGDCIRLVTEYVSPMIGQKHLQVLMPKSFTITDTVNDWSATFGPLEIPNAELLQAKRKRFEDFVT